MTDRVVKSREGKFARDFLHCERLIPGEVVVQYNDGEEICAWINEAIVFPNNFSRLGDERWYRATILED
ncbi:MAG: hypothetical protein NZL83_00370 [Candidatus Absconditabacterales bacterium]|nr:hypothetical protein [Candidatus Absconditabacterales bacterium]